MTLAEARRARGLSLEQCAIALGMSPSSKGHLSRLETGAVDFPVRLALQIEDVFDGDVSALDLLSPEDARLLRAAIVRAGGQVPAEALPA